MSFMNRLRDKSKNMTDTNLLLLITIVVFFAMYIGAILFQGKRLFKAADIFQYFECQCFPDHSVMWNEPCYDYRRN